MLSVEKKILIKIMFHKKQATGRFLSEYFYMKSLISMCSSYTESENIVTQLAYSNRFLKIKFHDWKFINRTSFAQNSTTVTTTIRNREHRFKKFRDKPVMPSIGDREFHIAL